MAERSATKEDATLNEQWSDRLTIGQMANLACTTVKTLRLYQQAGILTPTTIDENTGYRYYSSEQALELDRIQRLQAMGFTLAEIREYLQGTDRVKQLRVLSDKLESINRRILELDVARNDIKFLLSRGDCLQSLDQPGSISLKWQGARDILTFEIGWGELPHKLTKDEVVGWYDDLNRVKRALIERDIPLALFRDVSIMMDGKALERGKVMITRLFVPIDNEQAPNLPGYQHIAEGFWLVTHEEMVADDNDESREHHAILRLVQYARDNHLRIAGDLLDEGDVIEPFDPHHATNKMLKIQLPVEFIDD